MRFITIHRDFISKEQSLGVCYVTDNFGNILFKSDSIERGWLNNKKRISCIPSGTYPVKLEYSPRFKKDLWEIYEVPNRSECKFHAANYARQLNGCIALGNGRADIDKDGNLDVLSSRKTMKKFHKALEGYSEAILTIKNLQDEKEI